MSQGATPKTQNFLSYDSAPSWAMAPEKCALSVYSRGRTFGKRRVSNLYSGGDLGDMSPAELAREFVQAAEFFRGFLEAAERVNYAVYVLTNDALHRAEKARIAAERYAGATTPQP